MEHQQRERKTEVIRTRITPTNKTCVDRRCQELGMNYSEFIEFLFCAHVPDYHLDRGTSHMTKLTAAQEATLIKIIEQRYYEGMNTGHTTFMLFTTNKRTLDKLVSAGLITYTMFYTQKRVCITRAGYKRAAWLLS